MTNQEDRWEARTWQVSPVLRWSAQGILQQRWTCMQTGESRWDPVPIEPPEKRADTGFTPMDGGN